MPVTGDTIVLLADCSRCQVCHIQPGMVLLSGTVVRTIIVSQFTGWLYTISPHFIATGDTIIGENKQVAKTVTTKRHYATTDVYDFAFSIYSVPIITTNNHAFWSDVCSAIDNIQQMQILRMPELIEFDPDSKVYHRIWDAEAKVWRHELVV